MRRRHAFGRRVLCLLTILVAQRVAGQSTVRGSGSREGVSRFAFGKDASGCPSTTVSNTRFLLLQDTGSAGKVLRETIRTEHCLTAESTQGKIEITAWRSNSASSAPPLFSFHASAQEGQIDGEFYRTTEHGCCGPVDLRRYFSLENGREVFASSGPLLRIKIAGGSERVIAVHDTYSATLPVEAETDSAVVAVLEYGDGVSPSLRWVLRASRPRYYLLDSLFFVRRGHQTDSTEVWFTRPYSERTLPIVINDIRIVIRLRDSEDDSVIRTEIPIENTGPQSSKAVSSASLRIIGPSVRSKPHAT